jgi:glycerophosphoryl diester phosphodiesterase
VDAGRSALFSMVRRIKTTDFSALTCAHRGASQDAPENTLGAFARALDAGADLVEFDVHVSKDGEVVVIHDEKLDRTTDGSGEVWRHPFRAIQELDAGSWFGKAYANERVPSLDQTLDLLRGRAIPLIEVKVKKRRSADAGQRIVRCLERHGMLDGAVVICRELARAQEVHEACPRTPIAYLTYTKGQARGAARIPSVLGVDCYWKSLSLRLIEELRKARDGFFLTPWTVNRRVDQERLLLLGVETLITDCPGALHDLIERFEFSRTDDILERFRATGEDVDLELDASGRPDSQAPSDVSAELGTDSEVDLVE